MANSTLNHHNKSTFDVNPFVCYLGQLVGDTTQLSQHKAPVSVSSLMGGLFNAVDNYINHTIKNGMMGGFIDVVRNTHLWLSSTELNGDIVRLYYIILEVYYRKLEQCDSKYLLSTDFQLLNILRQDAYKIDSSLPTIQLLAELVNIVNKLDSQFVISSTGEDLNNLLATIEHHLQNDGEISSIESTLTDQFIDHIIYYENVDLGYLLIKLKTLQAKKNTWDDITQCIMQQLRISKLTEDELAIIDINSWYKHALTSKSALKYWSTSYPLMKTLFHRWGWLSDSDLTDDNMVIAQSIVNNEVKGNFLNEPYNISVILKNLLSKVSLDLSEKDSLQEFTDDLASNITASADLVIDNNYSLLSINTDESELSSKSLIWVLHDAALPPDLICVYSKTTSNSATNTSIDRQRRMASKYYGDRTKDGRLVVCCHPNAHDEAARLGNTILDQVISLAIDKEINRLILLLESYIPFHEIRSIPILKQLKRIKTKFIKSKSFIAKPEQRLLSLTTSKEKNSNEIKEVDKISNLIYSLYSAIEDVIYEQAAQKLGR